MAKLIKAVAIDSVLATAGELATQVQDMCSERDDLALLRSETGQQIAQMGRTIVALGWAVEVLAQAQPGEQSSGLSSA